MKNWLFALMIFSFMGLLAFQTYQQRKLYTVSAPIEFWVQISNGIEFTKNNLKTSDLPSKTVTLINDSLFAPFQAEISKQINTQIAAEQKKDTSNPKK